MASVLYLFINPKNTDVTVNAQTVPARNLKVLTIDDTTTDLQTFLTNGLAAMRSNVDTIEQREIVGHTLEELANYAL